MKKKTTLQRLALHLILPVTALALASAEPTTPEKNTPQTAQKKKAGRFPAHWGPQPKLQTRDLVNLPGEYGRGSSTLRNWIKKNLEKDRSAPAKAPTNEAENTKPLPLLLEPRQKHGNGNITINGDTQWRPVTLTLDGPFAHQLDRKPNPSRDYSLIVTFTHSSGTPEHRIPGYFAADGKAAALSAKSGTKWRAHFIPNAPGDWTYTTTFLSGKDIALSPILESPEENGISIKTLKQYSKSGEITVKAFPR